MKILLATTNQGKIQELKDLIHHYAKLNQIEIISLKDLNHTIQVNEDQDSFYGNALKKAKEYYHTFKIPVIADDSGLVVPSINNEPGVYSARYAGPNSTDLDNIQFLLKKITPNKNPNAYFESSVVYYAGENQIFHSSGKIQGQIIHEMRGSNGFGYDPVFFIPSKNKTMAELTLEEKNQISHRKQAFDGVLKQISSC